MLEVGQVRVPAQGDGVDVDNAVFGRQEVEVNHLRGGPHAPVGLRRSRGQRVRGLEVFRLQRSD